MHMRPIAAFGMLVLIDVTFAAWAWRQGRIASPAFDVDALVEYRIVNGAPICTGRIMRRYLHVPPPVADGIWPAMPEWRYEVPLPYTTCPLVLREEQVLRTVERAQRDASGGSVMVVSQGVP